MMLLPVLPFMTKSNPDLTLNLVSPLGFPGSLSLVTPLLLPAMSNRSVTPTPQLRGKLCSVCRKSDLVSNDAWAEIDRALGQTCQSGMEATEKAPALLCECECECV